MPTFTPTRAPFRTQLRAAAMELVGNYAVEADPPISLQTYPGRPATIHTPTAFVDRISEKIVPWGPARQQRRPTVELVVLHGLFDSKAAVDAGDVFVDGFIDYVATLGAHAANGRSTLGIPEYEDLPAYVADWLPLDQKRVFYATVFAIEGLILD